LLAPGCQRLPAPMPGAMAMGGGMGDLVLQAAPITLAPPPPPPIDMRGMYADDFVPPGAQRILPARAVTPKLLETPQIKYPGMEPLPSPNGLLTVFSDSGEAKKVMVHWVMLYRKGATRPESLFHTRNSFEVLWAADNQRLAITDFVGDNRSTVTIVDVRDDETAPLVDLRPALLPYFTVEQLASPTFIRAHRWSEGGVVLIRGIGRSTVAPFDQFGYEVLVDLANPTDAQGLVFVGGYLKKNG
jgi:hypothetical protein